MAFKKATKTQSKGRMALVGPSGSGKTYTALRVASALAQGGRIAVIDSERGSASKYADLFDFDVCELDEFGPQAYVSAIYEAEQAGYAVIIADSISHAWDGQGGALDQQHNATKRSKSGNSYMAWREITPIHNRFVDAMVGCSAHFIATMRAKTEYVLEENGKGQKVPRKIGMAPVQRAGMEYEFDVVCDLDHELNSVVTKTRCPQLSEKVYHKAGENDLGEVFLSWLTSGTEAPEQTFTEADRDRVAAACQERCEELGIPTATWLPKCGAESVSAVGFATSKEVPRALMNDLLQQIAHWTPPHHGSDEFNQDIEQQGEAAA